MARQTGMLLTAHNGVRYFLPAADAATGLEQMAEVHAQDRRYGTGLPKHKGGKPGDAWDDPRTTIDFIECDDEETRGKHRVIERLRGPKEEPAAAEPSEKGP